MSFKSCIFLETLLFNAFELYNNVEKFLAVIFSVFNITLYNLQNIQSINFFISV